MNITENIFTNLAQTKLTQSAAGAVCGCPLSLAGNPAWGVVSAAVVLLPLCAWGAPLQYMNNEKSSLALTLSHTIPISTVPSLTRGP